MTTKKLNEELAQWQKLYGPTLPLRLALLVAECGTKQGLHQALLALGLEIPERNHFPLAWCEEVARRPRRNRKGDKE